MNVAISPTPDLSETAETVRFLERFSDLMSTGSNSENLLRAARLLEAYVGLARESSELLRVERIRGDTISELRKTLEAKIAGLEAEVADLKSQLSEQRLKLNQATIEAERNQNDLLHRAEEAEAALAALQSEVARTTPGDTHVLVPAATLRSAKAQFESLAHAFEKSGNIVSQVRCEASATNLERAIVDAGAGGSEDRSKHAA